MFIRGETVTIVRSPGKDQYGDPIPPATTDKYTDTYTDTYGVAGTPIRIDIPRCAVAPWMSTEPTARGRQGVVDGLSLYPPPGSGILFTDQLEVRGLLYEVVGDLGQWMSPYTGWTPGDEVALRRAVG